MAISHELSGEIAAALFAAKKRSPRELIDLKELIFKIHNTLQDLADNARTDRHKSDSKAKRVPTTHGLN